MPWSGAGSQSLQQRRGAAAVSKTEAGGRMEARGARRDRVSDKGHVGRASNGRRSRPVRLFAWLHQFLVTVHALWASVVGWFVDNVMHSAEEYSKSVMREASHQMARWAHKASYWAGALMGGSAYSDKVMAESKRLDAWRKWWSRPRMSTLNAVLDRATPPHAQHSRPPPVPVPPQLPRDVDPDDARAPSPAAGADLFERSGWWQDPGNPMHSQRSGLLEDVRISLEVFLTRAFHRARLLVRALALARGQGTGAHGVDDGESDGWTFPADDISGGITPEAPTPAGLSRVGSHLSLGRANSEHALLALGMGGTLPTKPRALPQHPAPGLALDRQLNLTRLSERLTQLKEAGEGSSEGSDAASNGEGDGAVGLAGAPSLAEALFGLRRSGGQSQSRPAATPEGRTTPTATPRGGRPAATGAGTGAGLSPRGAPAGPEGPQSAGLAPAHSGLGARGAVGAVLGGAGSVSLRRSSSFARGIGGGVPGRGTADDGALTGREAAAGSVGGVGRGSLRRTRSFSKFEDLQRSPHLAGKSPGTPAKALVEQAGYPYESYEVVTRDGYVLALERIPRPGAKRVVFFMHGVMDTSVGWVANGPQRSQALAAWDEGYDVFLGNMRSSPPWLNVHYSYRSARYWAFNINHLATVDMECMIDRLHQVKCAELGVLDVGEARAFESQLSGLSTAPSWAAEAVGLKNMERGEAGAAGQQALRDLGARVAGEGAGGARSKGQGTGVATGGVTSGAAGQRAPRLSTPTPMSTPAGTPPRSPLKPGIAARGRVDSSPHTTLPGAVGDARGSLWAPAGGQSLGRRGAGAAEQGRASAGDGHGSTPHAGGGAALPATLSARVSRRSGDAARAQGSFEFLPAGSQSGRLSGVEGREGGGEGNAKAKSEDFTMVGARGLRGMPRRGLGVLWVVGLVGLWVTAVWEAVWGWVAGVRRWLGLGWEPAASGEAAAEGNGGVPTGQRKGVGVGAGGDAPAQPYTLQAVAHSLGGMCVLMYCVNCEMEGRPHRFSRLVLLSPAGFHVYLNGGMRILLSLLLWGTWFLQRVLRQKPLMGFRVPASFLRSLFFKLALDIHRMPALRELVRLTAGWLTGKDDSDWERALLLPHFRDTMPAVSLLTAIHFAQCHRSKRFQMYDYGPRINFQIYGQRTPIDVGAQYFRLKVPVDLIAGTRDGVITRENIQVHFNHMWEQGVKVSYKEFDFAHLDFTFGLKEDAQQYVMSRLRLSS